MQKIRLNKIEIQKLYDLAIDDRDIFEIIQEPNCICESTKVVVKTINGDEEYNITDYSCW